MHELSLAVSPATSQYNRDFPEGLVCKQVRTCIPDYLQGTAFGCNETQLMQSLAPYNKSSQ